MIITFCGHSDFFGAHDKEARLLSLLETRVGNEDAQMYLGGYGAFDAFAYACCKKYKETHPRVRLVYVTPYMRAEHLAGKKGLYDEILYPPIEDKPMRFAISYRNQYMAEHADLVIAYIDHTWGGAYRTYLHAKRKGKVIYNLADLKEK